MFKKISGWLVRRSAENYCGSLSLPRGLGNWVNPLLDNIPICYLSVSSLDSHSSSSAPSNEDTLSTASSSSEIQPLVHDCPIYPRLAEGLPRKQTRSQFTSLRQLNFADADELDANRHLMEDGQQQLWKIRNTKATEEFSKRYSNKYLESLTFQIASNALKAGKMAYCMNSNLGKPTPCENWLLCDRCAFYHGTLRLQQYSEIFDHDLRFFFVTLGFDGHLAFSSHTAENCRPFWDSNKGLIKSLHNTNFIEGAYLVHEIKVSSFLPLTANPHSHALVISRHPLDEVEQQIQAIAQGAGLSLQSSIRIKEIGDTDQDREKVIRYLTKSIDLMPAYSSAWNTHCLENRDRAPELNVELKECFDAIAAAFDRYHKIHYFGNLMAQSRSFIGKAKKQVIKARNRAKRKLKLKRRKH